MPASMSPLPPLGAVLTFVVALSGCARCVDCTVTDTEAMPVPSPGDAATVTLVEVPAHHGLCPMDRVTVQPGDVEVRGNVQISCPGAGAPCVVTVSEDGTVGYESAGGRPAITRWTAGPHETERTLDQRARNARPPTLFSFGGAVVTCKALGCPVPEAVHVDHTSRRPRLRDLSGFTFLARRSGVSLAVKVSGPEDDHRHTSYRALSGWMDHSFFLVESMNAERPSEFFYETHAMGTARRDNPDVAVSGTATWSGVMAGVVTLRAGTPGSFVNGAARLTVTALDTASEASVHLEFSDIVAEDTGADFENMSWSDLTLRDGSFGTGNVVHDRGGGFFAEDARQIPRGDGIFGQFYGPNHEEAGGLFTRRGISGAFAARRARSP